MSYRFANQLKQYKNIPDKKFGEVLKYIEFLK